MAETDTLSSPCCSIFPPPFNLLFFWGGEFWPPALRLPLILIAHFSNRSPGCVQVFLIHNQPAANGLSNLEG